MAKSHGLTETEIDRLAPWAREAITNGETAEALAPELTPEEAARRSELEARIRKGLKEFIEVGEALLEMRDSHLYRNTHPTFGAYCLEEWRLDRRQAYRLIDAAKVASILSPMGDKTGNERQARELAPLLGDPEMLIEVWNLVRVYGDRISMPITATLIQEMREELLRRSAAPGHITVKPSDLEYRPDLFQARDTTPDLPYNEARVNQIVESWDPYLFTEPKVVADPDKPGRYIVMEGQHRTEAWRRHEGDQPFEALLAPDDLRDPAQLSKAQLEADQSNTTTRPLNVREEIRNMERATATGETQEQVVGRLGKSATYVWKLEGIAKLGGQTIDRVVIEHALFEHAAVIGQAMDTYGITTEDANGIFKRTADAPKGRRPTVTTLKAIIDKGALAFKSAEGIVDAGRFPGMGPGFLSFIDPDLRIVETKAAEGEHRKRLQQLLKLAFYLQDFGGIDHPMETAVAKEVGWLMDVAVNGPSDYEELYVDADGNEHPIWIVPEPVTLEDFEARGLANRATPRKRGLGREEPSPSEE